MQEAQNFLQTALDFLAVLLPYILIPLLAFVGVWVRTRWEEFRLNQPEHIQRLLESAALFGADFAEQVNLAGILEDYAHTKKDAALNAASNYLKEQGYDVNLSLLDAAIERVLFNNKDRYPKNSN